MFNNALQGWTCEDRCLRLRCLVFLREMLVVALVSGFGLFLQAPDSSTAYVANDDSVFMRQLMALPLTGEMDNLLIAIRVFERVHIIGSVDESAERVADLERYLQRQWLSAIGGLPPPKAETIADAIAFEKRMEASAPRNMLALTQGVYSKALRVEPAAMGDLPSEEIRRYPDKYESVGKHAWKRSGSGVAPLELEISLTNQTKRALPLPPLIGLFIAAATSAENVTFECTNGAIAPWEGGGGARPKWRDMAPQERALFLCRTVRGAEFVDNALQRLNNRNAWFLRPALYFIQDEGHPPAEDLNVISFLSSAETDLIAERMLRESTCSDRNACVAEYAPNKLLDALFDASSLLAGFIAGAISFSVLQFFKNSRSLIFAILLSGAAMMFSIVFILDLDPRWGVAGESMAVFACMQSVAAVVGIWLMYLVSGNFGARDA